MPDRLHDTVVLITGCTGIAAATAWLAAREGARVFIAGLLEEECRALAGQLQAEGFPCAWRAGDLTAAEASVRACEACLEAFGRIDAVFNVAGISGRRFGDGPVHECTEQGWDITMDVNAKTTYLVCREAVRRMLEQPEAAGRGRGAILNMASVLASSPERRHFASHAYAASKGAIIALTKAMAAYYAPQRIRVNAIAPALVRTPMSRRAQEDPVILDFMRTKQPLAGDMMDAVDVASSAVFLLSQEARMITGEVLTVDAGWSVST